jgi:putative hemolysin
MLTEKPALSHAVLESDGIRAGNLVVRLAENAREVEAAQTLRYRIFYEEMGGIPSSEAKSLKRDFDRFDAHCDHLLVLDTDGNRVAGTYRLLRRSAMRKLGRFYSEDEFDIGAITRHEGEILEMGRSCVHEDYRNRAVMQLLWRGIAAYVSRHNIQLLFGCASFPCTESKPHALPLSYLYHYHMAPLPLRARALEHEYVPMNLMPKDAIDVKKAFCALPSLIKGYMRAGSYVGDGAVIDPHCNTLDVCVVVQTGLITDKYLQRYASTATQAGV